MSGDSRRRRKYEPRKVRTCPLCGGTDFESIYLHLRDDHEGDTNMLAFHLAKALHRALNRRKL
jgi:hypothetical protein